MASTRKPVLDPAQNPSLAPVGEGSMQYLCLVYQDDRKLAALPDAELDSIVAGCIAWIENLDKNGQHVLSAGLQSAGTAVSLRLRNGRISATDGPFAETKAHLGGFTILRARDLNEAIAIASKLPATRTATVEVRPLLKPDVALSEALDRRISAAIRRCAGDAQTSIPPLPPRPEKTTAVPRSRAR
jgi:hypothetical protein